MFRTVIKYERNFDASICLLGRVARKAYQLQSWFEKFIQPCFSITQDGNNAFSSVDGEKWIKHRIYFLRQRNLSHKSMFREYTQSSLILEPSWWNSRVQCFLATHCFSFRFFHFFLRVWKYRNMTLLAHSLLSKALLPFPFTKTLESSFFGHFSTKQSYHFDLRFHILD